MSHVLVSCPRDRYAAHQFLEQKFRGDSPTRNYQWLPVDGAAFVRVGEVAAPAEDTVEFTITALPQRRQNGKRRSQLTRDQQQQWLLRHMVLHAGLEVTDIETQNDTGAVLIKSGASRFYKNGVEFSGVAVVRDRELLQHALNTGVGDGKAYGFGMLIVKGLAQ